MAVKKFLPSSIEENFGPMNSVSKENAKQWTRKKAITENLSPDQMRKMEISKKKKAVTSTKKYDRNNSKNIIKYIKI